MRLFWIIFGPNGITGVLIFEKGRQEGQSQSRCDDGSRERQRFEDHYVLMCIHFSVSLIF